MNQNSAPSKRGHVAGTPLTSAEWARVHDGYSDAKAKRPYRSAYDGWERHFQIQYEIGRAWASMASHGGRVPSWRADERPEEAFRRARRQPSVALADYNPDFYARPVAA